jgi:hypothetical protein
MSDGRIDSTERAKELAALGVTARQYDALRRKIEREAERAGEAHRRGAVDDAIAQYFAQEFAPFLGTPVAFAQGLDVLQEPSWGNWWVYLKALFALPLTDAELAVFQQCTGRDTPPTVPPVESFVIAGRRGGKSRIAAFVAAYLAVKKDYRAVLAPGEWAVVPIIAADQDQARHVLRFIKALFTHPRLALLVARRLRDAIELRTRVILEVHTASYRTTRGRTTIAVVADELAFWRTDEGSAEPDREILSAVRPGMATVEGALLLAISTPYARKGELFRAWAQHYGRADSDVLVWRAESRLMNPTLRASVVERALQDDPQAGASEYLAEWRRDVEAFLDPDAVAAVTVPDRRELPPVRGVEYVAFVDPSGGSQDSFTLCVAHREGERGIVDCVRERRSPFSPNDAVAEFATTLRAYGVTRVTGDRYGGAWVPERFAVHGIRYEAAELPKSDLYLALLPLINNRAVDLLDLPRLRGQLVGLERRVARGTGRGSVDHAPAGRDDLANAVAGALFLAVGAGTHRALIAVTNHDDPGEGAPEIDTAFEDEVKRRGAVFPGDLSDGVIAFGAGRLSRHRHVPQLGAEEARRPESGDDTTDEPHRWDVAE